MAQVTATVELPDPIWERGRPDPHLVAFDEIVAKAEALPDGEYVGALLQFPVADGYAVYRVERLGEGFDVDLAWIAYMDEWQADPALIKGLDADDVRDRVDRDRRLAASLGRR